MAKKFAALVAALLMTLGLSLAVAAPAQAYDTCDDASICMFNGFNGDGVRIIWHDKSDRPDCFNIPATYDNWASSIDNYQSSGSHVVYIYDNSDNCTGSYATIYAQQQTNLSGRWDNNIESFYVN